MSAAPEKDVVEKKVEEQKEKKEEKATEELIWEDDQGGEGARFFQDFEVASSSTFQALDLSYFPA
jgi:hypothetical protein